MLAGLTACNKGGTNNGTGGGSSSGGGSDAAGSKSPLDAALASLKTASQQTSGKKSAKIDGTQKVGPSTRTMKGAMDWSNGMNMTVDITTTGGPLAGKPMKAIYTPQSMYINMGMPLGGKNWIKSDYDAMAKKSPTGALMKDMMQNNDPVKSVNLLIASGKVQQAGKEDVRGVQATHYTGTVDVAEMVKLQGKSLSEADMKTLQAQLQQAGATKETIDLWIGPDNLLVKKREQMDGKQGASDSTVFYSDYGTKVSVTPPPASDTTTAPGA
ncbi:hypothetical protein [Streptomyces sp. GS7]|uniref:hypothetical protein n=1 Tax=Streptomyces sp. GS7 TaxID=2692234 RepID=UPI001316EC99|nr:hypothetical protein [Streptomyces sp. GS7]QHC20431.1 hypothetical protein GR130_02265 [Streptomyces sp. GS7]